MDPNWVENIRDQCIGTDVAFFLKQWADPCAEGRRARTRRAHMGRYAGPGPADSPTVMVKRFVPRRI